MRIGVLTGGGDCPGLNAAIRAVTRVATEAYKFEVIGIRDGFEGLIHSTSQPLGLADVRGVLRVGGTLLGSSNRTNPFAYLDAGHDTPYDASDRAQRTVELQNQPIHRKRLAEKKRAPEGARSLTLIRLRTGESRSRRTCSDPSPAAARGRCRSGWVARPSR